MAKFLHKSSPGEKRLYDYLGLRDMLGGSSEGPVRRSAV